MRISPAIVSLAGLRRINKTKRQVKFLNETARIIILAIYMCVCVDCGDQKYSPNASRELFFGGNSDTRNR